MTGLGYFVLPSDGACTTTAPAARDQFAGLLPVRERVSGPEHPDTLAARYEPIFLQANFP